MQVWALTKRLQKSTPVRLLIATTVCVFVAESIIMILLSVLPPLGTWTEVFFDATLNVALVLPVLYVFFYKSLRQSIIEQARSEEMLQTSEGKFRSYVDSSPYAIIVVERDGSLIDVNDATVKLSGYSTEELLAMNLIHFFAPKDRKMGTEHFSRVVTTGKSSGIVPIVIKSGARKQWEVEAVKLGEDRFLGFISDVTARVETEEALQESEEKFRTLVEYINVIPWRLSLKNHQYTFIGPQVERLLDFPVEYWTDIDSWINCIHPDDRQSAVEFSMRATKKGDDHDFEYRCVTSKGKIVWVRDIVSVRTDEKGVPFELIGYMVDITPRRQAEDELRMNASKLLEAQRIAQLGHYVLDIKTDSWTCSAELNEIFGLDKNHKKNAAGWLQIVHPEERETMLNYLQNDILTQHQKFDKEYRIIDAITGQQKWVHGLGDLKFDENNNPVEMFGTIQNITERKLEQEKSKLLLDNLPCTAMILEKGTRKIIASNNVAREMGANPGETCHGTWAKNCGSCSFCLATEVWETGETKSVEVESNGKHFNCIWVSLTDDLYVHYIFDITETKRLQELESRAAKLEMAGTIAGQVAHDLNNLLAPIMAYPDFIRDDLPHDHKSCAYLDDIESAAKKIADINQDLLTMGRRGHYSQDVVNLNDIALHAIKDMRLRTKTVVIETQLCPELMKIKGGSAQLHRMLTNLLVNARDAMEDIGQLTIKSENYYTNDKTVMFGSVPNGEYAKLTITDSGCGISDDIIQKILDPFFSTKTADIKRGSGLGLSVVDAVIKDHSGYLDLSSKVGQGTSFYLYFPVTRENLGKDEMEAVTAGTDKILVVDDDDVQREVTSKLLMKLGYEVSSVTSGEKATEFLIETPQDLVILDMVMPGGIDGAETYRQILAHNPQQKAIFLSGFSESDRVAAAQKLGAGAFIRKPITRSAIAAAVRAELDRKVETVTS